MAKGEYQVTVYDPKRIPWSKVGNDIEAIEIRHFGEGAFSQEQLEEWFGDPRNTAVVLTARQSGKVIGFTFAQPSKDAYNLQPEFYIQQLGRRGRRDTAYISDTAIHPEHMGKGLVVPMIELLEQALREKGYRYIERDAAVANGYAAKIAKVYRRDKRILTSSEHDSFFGRQRFFRIKL